MGDDAQGLDEFDDQNEVEDKEGNVYYSKDQMKRAMAKKNAELEKKKRSKRKSSEVELEAENEDSNDEKYDDKPESPSPNDPKDWNDMDQDEELQDERLAVIKMNWDQAMKQLNAIKRTVERLISQTTATKVIKDKSQDVLVK